MDIDTKIELIKSVGEELINEEELRALLQEKEHPVAYDGFEPSGRIHIAQGLLRAITLNKLTQAGIRFKFYVADWFGMLNNKMGGDLEKIQKVGEYFIEVWKASGLDMEKVEFIWASDFIKNTPGYWETVLKLSMNSTISRVMRCGQIMGREENTSNPSAQILYPLMQAADIYHLEADIAQLGLDQRKVNMLARDIFPKLGLRPPIALHHHMLLGLQFKDTEGMNAVDKKVELKMSKSKPETAIFMTDTTEDIKRKFKKAYCPEGVAEDNPVLEYCKYIVFERTQEFVVERPEKFGGSLTFKTYQELEDAFVKKELHPMDLKTATARYIDQYIEPVRRHFQENPKAKELLETVNSYY
ncbi:MAG: tyrosine--tRNA ligase [Nanobdellota archaeon]